MVIAEELEIANESAIYIGDKHKPYHDKYVLIEFFCQQFYCSSHSRSPQTYKNRASETNVNYLLTESEVFTGKSQAKTLRDRPTDSEVNTARPRFARFSLKV